MINVLCQVITADLMCLQGVNPKQCAEAAHTVHGIGTYDGGTMTKYPFCHDDYRLKDTSPPAR